MPCAPPDSPLAVSFRPLSPPEFTYQTLPPISSTTVITAAMTIHSWAEIRPPEGAAGPCGPGCACGYCGGAGYPYAGGACCG